VESTEQYQQATDAPPQVTVVEQLRGPDLTVVQTSPRPAPAYTVASYSRFEHHADRAFGDGDDAA
jgi:hypothetical protein